MTLSPKLWLAFLFGIIAIFIWWMSDSRNYDQDLEKDHLIETGLTWRDVEK